MGETKSMARCAVLAVVHGGLGEGIRDLLATAFASVVTVADAGALVTCVGSLRPELVVLDLVLPATGRADLYARLRSDCPGLRLIALCDVDDPGTTRSAKLAGADRYLIRHRLGSELLPAVDELLAADRDDESPKCGPLDRES